MRFPTYERRATNDAQGCSCVPAIVGEDVMGSAGQDGIEQELHRVPAGSSAHCRILYLVGQLGPGGLERQLYYLILAMNRERYAPAVAVWNYREDDLYAQQLRVLRVPLFSVGNGSRHQKLRRLRGLVRTLKPEVLHSYSFYTNFAAWWCTRRSQTIPFGSIRNNFFSDRRLAGRVLGRLCARWPAAQICNSLCAKAAVEESPGPFKPTRLLVVTNRLDVASFKVVGSLPDKPMLLAVGRLVTEKRWDRLVDVMALLNKRGISFSVRLVGNGPLRQALEAQAKRVGVEHLIEFLGIRHDVPSLLADSTFLVHTADEEGCPNVVMEAMACGRAVVATDAGDVPCLIDDGITGFIVKRGDNGMLEEQLATLIENRELCRLMGQAGRTKAEEDFGLCKLMDQTFQAYRVAGWKG
jgi:glycosyltransferase involved in cell wall biosynthesis